MVKDDSKRNMNEKLTGTCKVLGEERERYVQRCLPIPNLTIPSLALRSLRAKTLFELTVPC